MLALIFFLFSSLVFGQTGTVNIIGGKVDLSGAVHTLPTIVVATVGALPATCTAGELAIVTAATLGQQIYECSAGNVWTQQLNSGGGGGNGGGITVYSGSGLTVTANTYYIPIGGGGTPSTTETNVDVDSPSAATVTNLFVQQSVAIGAGNSAVYTWRKNGSSQTLTCTISGASATSCSDTTHNFSVAQGDLVTIQLVTTGTIVVTPNIQIATQFGTTGSNGTVNTGTAGQFARYAANGTAVSGVVGPFTLLSEQIVSGTAATITFSSIPGTYRNLRIVVNARSDVAALFSDIYMQFNGDTGANYSRQTMNAHNTTVSAAQNISTATAAITTVSGSTSLANVAGSAVIDIPNYSGTTFFKGAISNTNLVNGASMSTFLFIVTTAFQWVNTSAITSITLGQASGNFITGSTFDLYAQ